jgi:ABC-type glucose/galactose transport system permease subunit
MVLRLRAVYLNHRVVSAIFFSLWLCCSAVTIGTVIPAIGATYVSHTQSCAVHKVSGIAGIGIILNAVDDTLIFIAITVRLLHVSTQADSWRTHVKSFFGYNSWNDSCVRNATHPQPLVQAMVRGGQQYYL